MSLLKAEMEMEKYIRNVEDRIEDAIEIGLMDTVCARLTGMSIGAEYALEVIKSCSAGELIRDGGWKQMISSNKKENYVPEVNSIIGYALKELIASGYSRSVLVSAFKFAGFHPQQGYIDKMLQCARMLTNVDIEFVEDWQSVSFPMVTDVYCDGLSAVLYFSDHFREWFQEQVEGRAADDKK